MVTYNASGCAHSYLCTKRLLSRYASAVLSWEEYKMSVARSRLYFLTWRNDRNYGKNSRERNHLNQKKTSGINDEKENKKGNIKEGKSIYNKTSGTKEDTERE